MKRLLKNNTCLVVVQGIVILFRFAWLQHYTMPIRVEGRQLGCALYLRKQTLSQYELDKQICLASIELSMNLYEQEIPLEDERKAKWVRLKVLCASPIVAMTSMSGTKIDLQLEGQKTAAIEMCP